MLLASGLKQSWMLSLIGLRLTVIKGSGGCRKVRWTAPGRGKSGGARVIYFNVREQTIWLLMVYTKNKFDSLPPSFLAELKQGVEDVL